MHNVLIIIVDIFLFFNRDSDSPQDLSKDAIDKESCSFNEEDTKSEDGPSSPPSTPASSSGPVTVGPPPPLIPFSPQSAPSCNTNPLHQMVSITNALTALPPHSSPTSPLSFRNNGSRPTNKVVLPPISQQQFDKYSHINTDLLVRKVSGSRNIFSKKQD
jgi:hypothetical protein